MILAAWLFEPLRGLGYQFWSGIGSDVGELTILTAAVVWVRHHNCHRKGCWRLGHIDSTHGHPACRHHHSKAAKLS